MNVAEFNARMAALPEPPGGYKPPYWQAWRRELWERGQVEDPNGFMGWPCIYHTMLVRHWSMEWQLNQLEDAGQYWGSACHVPDVVLDPPAQLYPGTYLDTNLINLAYHFLMWEQRTGMRISNLKSIVEWGGGYGGQALVARRLGFAGKYIIYDLPEFRLLQEWFLEQVGVEADTRSGAVPRKHSDLLIGIYSLSEMPLADRQRVLDRLTADSYLLVYSNTWEDYDNEGWFYDWACGKPGYTWRQWPMSLENERPDLYCIGWRE